MSGEGKGGVDVVLFGCIQVRFSDSVTHRVRVATSSAELESGTQPDERVSNLPRVHFTLLT